MNQSLVGSIYGRSSIKIAHVVLIGSQTWLPQEILVSDWLISKKNMLKERYLLFKYRYLYSKCSYLYTDIADFLDSSPLQPLGQMN